MLFIDHFLHTTLSLIFICLPPSDYFEIAQDNSLTDIRCGMQRVATCVLVYARVLEYIHDYNERVVHDWYYQIKNR